MSAHVLLNLLNELRKIDKMRGLLSLFRNEFDKFNIMKDYVPYDYKSTLKSRFVLQCKAQEFAMYARRR